MGALLVIFFLDWCDRWLCRLKMMFWFLSLLYNVYLCFDDLDKQNTYNHRQKIKSMIINML